MAQVPIQVWTPKDNRNIVVDIFITTFSNKPFHSKKVSGAWLRIKKVKKEKYPKRINELILTTRKSLVPDPNIPFILNKYFYKQEACYQ